MTGVNHFQDEWPGLTDHEKTKLEELSGIREQAEIQSTLIDEKELAVTALVDQINNARETARGLRGDLFTARGGLVASVIANEQIPELKRGALVSSLYTPEGLENPLAKALQLEQMLRPLHEALQTEQIVLQLKFPIYSEHGPYITTIGRIQKPGLQLEVKRGAYMESDSTYFKIDTHDSYTVNVASKKDDGDDFRRRTESSSIPHVNESHDQGMGVIPRDDMRFMTSPESISDFFDGMSTERVRTNGRSVFSTETTLVVGKHHIETLVDGLANFKHPSADTLLQSVYLALMSSEIEINMGDEAKRKIEEWRGELAATSAAELLNSTYMSFGDQSNWRRQQIDPFYSGEPLSERDYYQLAKALRTLGINTGMVSTQITTKVEDVASKLSSVVNKDSRSERDDDFASAVMDHLDDSLRLRKALALRMAEVLFSDQPEELKDAQLTTP